MNPSELEERDERGNPIIAAQFDTISPENVLKWGVAHPRLDGYNFEAADRYVAFGEKPKMFIVGHCLVWHSQTPRWVFEDDQGKPRTRAALLALMREHIRTVVGRYKGRINGWDVVHEALNEDGTMRQSPWHKISGQDYLLKAFQFAHEADPQAELYDNDYSLENEPKRKGAVELIRNLKLAGARGHGRRTPGPQPDGLAHGKAGGRDHRGLRRDRCPGEYYRTRCRRSAAPNAAEHGGCFRDRVANSNPYKDGLREEVQQALAKRYAGLDVFVQHRDVIDRVTFWGITDGDSWLNNFPTRGRTNYPLPFNRQGKPKPAFDAVLNVAPEK